MNAIDNDECGFTQELMTWEEAMDCLRYTDAVDALLAKYKRCLDLLCDRDYSADRWIHVSERMAKRFKYLADCIANS